ncbi:putative histone methylation protein Dot1 [Usnea florida]
MGFFDSIQKPGFAAAKGKNIHIKQEIVKTVLNPQKTFVPFPQQSKKPFLPDKMPTKPNSQTAKPSPKARAQNPRKRLASTPQRLESDSDDDISDQDFGNARKRARRISHMEPDPKRHIRNRKAFSEEDGGVFPMVHAADVASLSKPTKYKAAFPNDPQAIRIRLQYPSASQSEKYETVVPIFNDDFKALEDIREVIEIIISNYLPNAEATRMQNDSTGLIRRLKRATERRAGTEYMDFVQEWNDTLIDLRKDGTISKTIDEWKGVDLKLLERILTQTYSRTVSPRVHTLRHYQNGTDNVYGELLPKFISLILKQDVKMKSDQIFVDLGSGVGNCVLQAALEVGCESWGCEMMENACDLAELQEKEFNARCRLWGLSAGEIHLERGDFLKNSAILKVLQKADVILVNNQAFTPNLNEDLTNLFLDLKEGAKIVSLKSFVPHGHKITSKNLSAACNRLEVIQKTYFSACVSWTETAGTYYVSTKDSSKVQAFAEKNM